MIFLLLFTVVLATLFFLAFLLNQQVKFIVFVLQFVTTIVDLITLPFFLLIDQPWKIKRTSKTVSAERHYEPNGEYFYWQAKETKKEQLPEKYLEFKNSVGKLTHLSQLLPLLGKLHKGKKCLGTRKVLGKKLVNGQVQYELSNDYEWRTYDQVLGTIRDLAKVLYHKFQLKRGDRVATFAETSPEFTIIFFALQTLGCEVVVLRSTPNEATIPFVLNDHEIEFVFTQASFVKLLNKLKPNIPKVRRLVCFHNPFGSEESKEEIRNVKFEFFEYEQLLKEARHLPDLDFGKKFQFASSDISNVITTSGSSGVPKGVLVTHANWLAYINTMKLKPIENRTFLAYIEGSQIMELSREFLYLVRGEKMAYGTEDTFLTGSRHLADGTLGDMPVSDVTHWLAHPLTLLHIRNSIETSIRNGPIYLQAIHEFAYSYAKMWARRGFRCRLMDALVFKPVKNRYSKRLEVVFTGGAPVLHETCTFFQIYFDAKVTLGYGSSECMAHCVSSFDRFDDTDALAIVDGIKLRLENWEEGGYRVNDHPYARGEVIIGSKTVSAGYHNRKEDTAEAFFEENGIRWWRSGDIAEINEYGLVSLIDRKSNFTKLQSANYFISMGMIESILQGCRLVENIAIHVNGYYDFVTAIVSPNEANIREMAKELGKSSDDLKSLCKDPDLEKAVVDELAKFGKTNGLIPVEVPAYVKLVPEKWTKENGLVSETQKTRRKQVYKYYENSIETMYKAA